MAKIFKTSEQLTALNSVREGLKDLENMNLLLHGSTSNLSIVFTADSKKHKFSVSLRILRPVLLKLLRKEAQEIRGTAETYNIVLSDHDRETLLTAEGNSGESVNQEEVSGE